MAVEKTVIVNVKDNGTEETAQKVKKLNGSLGELESKNDDVKQSMDRSQQSVLDNGGAMGLLNDATGGVAMTIKDAVEATALFAKESKIGMAVTKAYTFVMGTSTGAMKAFKIALISTGIGAIVIGLGLLIANFDKVKAAVMNLIPGLSAIGDFFGKIINAVTDFIGVTSDLSRELDKLNKASQKMLEDNKDLLASFGDQLSEFQKKQVEIANSLAERIKEINEKEGIELEEKNRLIRLAQERAKRDLLKNIDDTNAEVAKKRQEERDKIAAENERERADAYNLEAEKREKRKALEDKLAEDDRKRNEEGNKLLKEIEAEEEADAIEKENIRLEKREEDIKREHEAEKAILEQKAELKRQSENLLYDGLKVAKDVFEKNKAVQRGVIIVENALALASLVKSTIKTVGKDNEASPLTFGMPWSGVHIAQGALGAAQIISSTSKALQAVGGGSAGSAPSMGGGSTAASVPPQFNIVGQNSNNQLAQTISKQQSLPVEAYVVSGAVTSAQAMDRNRIKTATFN
ncbi:MAG: hypothetical protein WAW57_15200 [Lutibacter sp.]